MQNAECKMLNGACKMKTSVGADAHNGPPSGIRTPPLRCIVHWFNRVIARPVRTLVVAIRSPVPVIFLLLTFCAVCAYNRCGRAFAVLSASVFGGRATTCGKALPFVLLCGGEKLR